MKFIETDKVYLRNLQPSDINDIYDYRNNENCYKYQRWDALTEDAITAYIQKFKKDVFLSTKSEQHFAICKKDDLLIGELAYFFNEEDNCITLGITISYKHQKNGHAFEILSEVIQQIQNTYPTIDIVGLIDKNNFKSRNLFEKLGFEQECYAEPISSYIYTLMEERQMIRTDNSRKTHLI